MGSVGASQIALTGRLSQPTQEWEARVYTQDKRKPLEKPEQRNDHFI